MGYIIIAVMLFIIILLMPSVSFTLLARTESKTLLVPDDYLTLTEDVANADAGDTIRIKEGRNDEPKNKTLIISKPLTIIGFG